ncbi:hypothetical protein [Peribacillus deserti]|uniref:Uncharacterized protein n=1 Tax=Peribacillus deserti TaxID=673318 RepID=A0A2N5LZX2_9BACI|nr:hypothetical protein [Peribacillus deserti]PLT27615.1 hypothetical protein CUU66_23005 [Peribacillus deserti]
MNYSVSEQDRFDVRLKYGRNLENEINTADKKMVVRYEESDVTKTTSDFTLTEGELSVIYQNIVLSNYLDQKVLNHSCHSPKNSMS